MPRRWQISSECPNNVPQGLKPSWLWLCAARLKPCPSFPERIRYSIGTSRGRNCENCETTTRLEQAPKRLPARVARVYRRRRTLTKGTGSPVPHSQGDSTALAAEVRFSNDSRRILCDHENIGRLYSPRKIGDSVRHLPKTTAGPACTRNHRKELTLWPKMRKELPLDHKTRDRITDHMKFIPVLH
jgi:hypothetical protein